ncbi:MAG TPA: hypothetical protein VLK65_14460 [Vicinamibacteria bacterium]|nr:hypothetical protein [Vicinamibacteria bacterium]
MIFTEVLRNVARRVDGCVGLVVMGMDGIPIERLVTDSITNFDVLATESTGLLRATIQASNELTAGAFKELNFVTESLSVLAVAITGDYVLLGAFRPGSNQGKGRFYLRLAAQKLEKEFL